MDLFCFLWSVFFYLLWRSLRVARSARPDVLGFLSGCGLAVVMFFAGGLVPASGFGFSRWLYGFFEITSFPLVFALLCYALFALLKPFPQPESFADFALPFLLAPGFYYAVTWNGARAPLYLVLPPLLWSALTLVMSLFAGLWRKGRPAWKVLSVLGLAFFPPAAAAAWWLFFNQRFVYGCAALALIAAPALVILVIRICSSLKTVDPPSREESGEAPRAFAQGNLSAAENPRPA